MISAERFCAELHDRGIGLVTGVPCSWLRTPLALMEREPGYYVPAANEGAALAVAAGAELSGSRAAVLLQNSGFGNLLNPLTSLVAAYRIPVLVLMTLRGWPRAEDDEPQHAAGAVTERLLEDLGIGHRVLAPDEASLCAALDEADEARTAGRPFFVLIPRGAIEQDRTTPPDCGAASGPAEPELDRASAVATLAASLTGSAVFTTTGRISRELFEQADRDEHFYMLGSMGHALALGLGAALARPDRRITVLDGDGALMMHLGTAVTVGVAGPANLVHVVLDNGSYESTGGQPASGPRDWTALGSGAGYRTVQVVQDVHGFSSALSACSDGPGPHLVVARLRGSVDKPRRHPLEHMSLDMIARRFQAAVSGPDQERTRNSGRMERHVSESSDRAEAAPRPPDSAKELRGDVERILAELASMDAVRQETAFAGLDLDSIALSYVFAFVERRFGVSFDNDDLLISRYGTVGDLCDQIEARLLGARS